MVRKIPYDFRTEWGCPSRADFWGVLGAQNFLTPLKKKLNGEFRQGVVLNNFFWGWLTGKMNFDSWHSVGPRGQRESARWQHRIGGEVEGMAGRGSWIWWGPLSLIYSPFFPFFPPDSSKFSPIFNSPLLNPQEEELGATEGVTGGTSPLAGSEESAYLSFSEASR